MKIRLKNNQKKKKYKNDQQDEPDEDYEDEEESNKYKPGTYFCENCDCYKRGVFLDTNRKRNRYYDKFCIECECVIITQKMQQLNKIKKLKIAKDMIRSRSDKAKSLSKRWPLNKRKII